MSKTIELKYDIGDVGYAMLGDRPSKVEVVNFYMDWNKKTPIEDRIQYEVRRCLDESEKVKGDAHPSVSVHFHNLCVNSFKNLGEIFDTKEQLIESLTKKIEQL